MTTIYRPTNLVSLHKVGLTHSSELTGAVARSFEIYQKLTINLFR
jgi:hypothetical protein